MEKRINFLKWLSKKLYLTNIGMYATVGLIMILPNFLAANLKISINIISFVVFFAIAFLRAAYESLVIYEAPVKSLSLHKMLILSAVTAGTLSTLSYFVKPMLGYFSIPVSIIIALKIVAQLKTMLWPTHERQGFFAELPAKLDLSKSSLYGFYGFLVGITYLAYGKYGFNFNYAFAAAFFVGTMFEELYNSIKIYEQTLKFKTILSTSLWSIACAITASTLAWTMIGIYGIGGQPATIIGVILIKLIQPIGSRKLVLNY